MTKRANPWKSISPEDYDQHMNHPTVNQKVFLSDCFHTSLIENAPREVLVIGCGTGNGLKHINSDVTKRTTVIDINAKFLHEIKTRFRDDIPGLEVIHGDLYQSKFSTESYSLVYAGLVFEFVEPVAILGKLSDALRQDGRLEVVLQIPNDNLPAVSSTNIEGMNSIKSMAKLVDNREFSQMCKDLGLILVSSITKNLDSGKSFFIGSYKKSGG